MAESHIFSIFSRHENDGMNVLFADDHVEHLTPAQAQTILQQAALGKRPIVYSAPTMQP